MSRSQPGSSAATSKKAARAFAPMVDLLGLTKLICSSLPGEAFGASSGPNDDDSQSGPDEEERIEAHPIPPDKPPGFAAPGHRQAPAFIHLNARFIAALKRDYGRGVATDNGRAIGDIPEVAEWLDSLEPGKARPRRCGT